MAVWLDSGRLTDMMRHAGPDRKGFSSSCEDNQLLKSHEEPHEGQR